MSPAESVERATQWLRELVTDLSGLRNATSRDPGFKNWRQNAITILQRIWPADQDHAERFRRIPFSPVDPRADMRAQRESFSRGCQEAARVLNSFIEEIRALGVPEIPNGGVQLTEESGFEDGFPTVDLPSGDLSVSEPVHLVEEGELEDLPSQVADPSFLPPTRPHLDAPANAPAPPAQSASGARQARKGLGVAAKLRDLLGLGGFSAKPAPPPQGTGNSTSLSQLPQRSLDIIPVGDEVESGPRSREWPMPQPKTHAPGAPPAAAAPEPPQQAAPGANLPPADAGKSVVMSRPTTLRSNIEKVSIESIFSPEFRSGGDGSAAAPQADAPPPAAAGAPASAASGATPARGNVAAQKRGVRSPSGATPAPRAAQGAEASGRPPLSIVPPLSSDPEFNVDPAPPATEAEAALPAPAVRANAPSKVVPLPLPPGARATESAAENATDEEADEPATRPDSAELARATADFMRTSPVLGATGRKVQHPPHESPELNFSDPDAIAVLSMVDELTLMGVPATRQSETRARLLDLARRMETSDLQWNALRKAVWFAMEYPEVARRLMPMLLPWIDRAA